ncbi:unnamed protein product [Blepharisma stoltei]|uniref:RING-type E3 ubiquitin transferase n=1 Tax=Blepharisma stoltei TaxID=1481888 RepID=A0AAU9J401_9CILI|nr:unnamed protein product [Blepharisma stoltei]
MGNSTSNFRIPITFSTDKNSLKRSSSIISSFAHIEKESISLKYEDEKYYLDFRYSARVRSTIQIFLCAHHSEFCNIQPDIPIIALTIQEGMSQCFPSDVSTLSLSEYGEEELTKYSSSYTPLIIQIIPFSSNQQIQQLHTSYLSFVKENGRFSVKLLRQHLKIGYEVYELVEIYGNYLGEKCSVCLSSKRDTLVFPCKHLCLCSRCAVNLKMQAVRKCPICRTPLESFLKISK